MPWFDLPADAQLDAPQGVLKPLPEGAQLDQPPMEGALRLPAIAGSALAKGAAEGIGAVGDLDNLMHGAFTRGIFDPLHRMVTGQPATAAVAAAGTADPLSSTALTGYGRQAGIMDRSDLSPQNAGERYLAAGAEGLGAMLPAAPLGAGGLIANTLRSGTMGTAGGVMGQGAADLFPNHPVLARLAGNLVGAIGAGTAMNAGNRVAGAAMGNSTPTLDAYRSLGVEPTLAGDVTGSPTMQMIQAYAAKSPGGAGRVHEASGRAVDQWGRALEDTAAGLGNSATLQDAGTALQSGATNWINQFKADSRRAWNQVDLYVPKSTPVAAQNYAMTLSDIRNQMPGAPATASVLQPSLSRNLLDSLATDIQKGPLTWQDMKGIRTRIGEMLSEPQIVGDTSHADLKRIYGGLTADMSNAVAARGPAAQTAFAAATDLTKNGHSFIENVLSNVIRGKEISPEQAARTVMNTGASGGTTLQAIRQEMPGAADELAAFKLRDMSLANPGQQNAAGSRLSPGTFLTDQNKMSPEAVNALFAHDPQLMQRLRDLSTVAGSMKSTERFLNTSNTGAHGAAGHAMASIVGSPIAALEGWHQAGVPGALAGALAAPALAYGPSYLAGRAVTSPLMTAMMAAPGAVPQSSGLLNRAAIYPALLRAMSGGAVLP